VAKLILKTHDERLAAAYFLGLEPGEAWMVGVAHAIVEGAWQVQGLKCEQVDVAQLAMGQACVSHDWEAPGRCWMFARI